MSDELKHYGILGMKWGIRRFQPYPKGQGHKGKYVGKPPKVSKKTRKSQKKSPEKHMSNKDLQRTINRLRLEKQYRELTRPDRSRGKRIANSIIGRIGDKVLDRIIDRAILDPIDTAFKSRRKR